MKFAQAHQVLAALLTVITAQSSNLPPDVFDCNNLGPNCLMQYDINSDVYTCSCVANSDQLHLGSFYTKTNYRGYLFQAHGDYGTCHNLPTFWVQNVASFISANDPLSVCCAYTDYNCNTVGRNWTQLNYEVADFAGVYEDGVISFRCSLDLIFFGNTCTTDENVKN